jgi:N-acetylmuramoyl-L-alanine amidase
MGDDGPGLRRDLRRRADGWPRPGLWAGRSDFGGDAQRTRVVLDLGKTTRGQVIEDGTTGRVIVALSDVAPGRGLDGNGSGLVRGYEVTSAGTSSRIRLDLARGAEIERRFLLPPGDGVQHYRYVIDLKATGAAAVAPNAPPRREQARKEKPLIVIDAGHGGRDPGAQGVHAQEKAVTLAAARELKAAIERTGRYRVRLTRDSDVYVIHGRRVQIARDAGADLFISLHADAGTDPALRGASVYTLSEQGAGRAVREYTRGSDWQRDLRLPGRDPSVDRILLDMTQRATQNRSAQFARVLLTHLEGDSHPLLRRSHRDAGLAVLLAPDVPAILLEMGFITNPQDEQVLTDERARRRLMRSVAEGIDRYFREPSAPVMVAGEVAGGG